MKQPLVTVLMPVYNAEKYVGEAVESILNQTYENFEFLIIDDGSIDNSKKIIRAYKDKRVKLRQHKNNLGLINTLNEGLRFANGKYIVRMDADDISLSTRLLKQVEYMEENEEMGICGSWIKFFGEYNYVLKTKENHEDIRARLLFENSIVHPSVILRRKVIRNHNLSYDSEFIHAEDYDLWVRASKITRLHNLPEVLLKYRTHEKQTSKTSKTLQTISVEKIREHQILVLGINPSEKERIIHNGLGSWEKGGSFLEIKNWLNKLYKTNSNIGMYNTSLFNQVLAERWLGILDLCEKNIVKKALMSIKIERGLLWPSFKFLLGRYLGYV